MSTTQVPTQPGGPPTATRIPSDRISSAQLEALAARVRTEGPREHMEIEQPFTGGPLGCVPKCTPEDVEAAIARAREAQARLGADELRRAPARSSCASTTWCSPARTRSSTSLQIESGKARRHAFEEVLDVAIVARYYANTAERHLAAPPPRRAAAADRRVRAPPPARRGRHHRALELPADARDLRRDPRAGRRQRRRHQARQPDAVHRAVGLRAARGGGPARGLVQVVTGSGSELGTPLIDEHRLRDVHRQHRDRPHGRRAGRAAADRRLDGARRQERDDRARRRRPRRGRRGRRAGAVLQRRPALHLDRAAVRARGGRRRVHAPARRARSRR